MEGGNLSLEERNRRWLNIRREMARSGLDGLVVLGDGHHLRRGSHRYVSDRFVPGMYAYVVFPVKGEPIAIEGYAFDVRKEWIKNIRVSPLRGGWVPESEPYAPIISDAIRELNFETGNIGIEGDFMPWAAYQRLVKELPKATFKPSNIIHELKMVKSPEELKFVEKGVEMVEKAYERCLEFARPGKTWNEISAELVKSLYLMGKEDLFDMPLSRSTSIIKNGDFYFAFLEVQGPGGFWIQFGRVVSFGEVKKELRDAWELTLKAQKRGAEKLRPGNTGADVMKAINDALKGTKYTGSVRGSGHGCALDILEKPFITLDDETVLKPGMVIVIHPIFSPLIAAHPPVCDMFVVTEGEPRNLSKIPPDLKVI